MIVSRKDAEHAKSLGYARVTAWIFVYTLSAFASLRETAVAMRFAP